MCPRLFNANLSEDGAEDDRYKSIFDNLTDEEFEDILKEYGFKYRKVDKGKGGLYINSSLKEGELNELL